MISSILIPTYNQAPCFLEAAVCSALRQHQPTEVVVIDDGSDVPVAAHVQALAVRLRRPEYLTLVRQDNGGVASALNAGLSVAKGEYIQWLSSDDLFRLDKTERQVAECESTGKLICYCSYEEGIPQSKTTWSAAQYPSREALFNVLKTHCFINACTVMWHRSVFEQVGPFDVTYRHAQDFEMLLRCAEQFKFAALNLPLVRRRIHSGQMLNTLKQPEEAERKRSEMQQLSERYGVTAKVWVPQGDKI